MTSEHKLIAVVGMTGSGKSVLADRLVDQGYEFIRFGQVILDIVKERGLEPTEENEGPIRSEVRKKHGMGAVALLSLPKINKLLETGNVVADGLYSWSEFKILEDEFGDRLTVVCVYAPPKVRYGRLSERMLAKEDKDLRNRPATFEQARNRDFDEIEKAEKGGPICMADYTILNIGSLEDYKKKIDEFMTFIKGD